jgi:hypothetical protein
MDAGEEVSGGLVIAGRDRSVLLELAIEVLHEVAGLIQFLFVEALNLSITLGRNDELFPAASRGSMTRSSASKVRKKSVYPGLVAAIGFCQGGRLVELGSCGRLPHGFYPLLERPRRLCKHPAS